MNLIACLETSALAGNRAHLIVGAACAVSVISLGLGMQRGLAQRITVSVLTAFVVLLMLGSCWAVSTWTA